MDCILFCIFLLALHQNNSGASSPQKAQLPTEVEASQWSWLLRLLAGPLVQGCLLETSPWLQGRRSRVRFWGSLTAGVTSPLRAVLSMHPCWDFPSLKPHRTLVTSNAPCMPDTTPRACNIFLTASYKMVTWAAGWDNSLQSLRAVELAFETELDTLKRSSCLELFATIKASKTYRRWRKILKKYQEQRVVF